VIGFRDHGGVTPAIAFGRIMLVPASRKQRYEGRSFLRVPRADKRRFKGGAGCFEKAALATTRDENGNAMTLFFYFATKAIPFAYDATCSV
jgi:hypothetical protein